MNIPRFELVVISNSNVDEGAGDWREPVFAHRFTDPDYEKDYFMELVMDKYHYLKEKMLRVKVEFLVDGQDAKGNPEDDEDEFGTGPHEVDCGDIYRFKNVKDLAKYLSENWDVPGYTIQAKAIRTEKQS